MNEDVQKLFEEGMSIRKIGKTLGITFGEARKIAIRLKLYVPKHKKVKEGKAKCRSCNRLLTVECFPALAQGNYECKECCSNRLWENGLSKIGCTPKKYQELYELQNGKCSICKTDVGHVSSDGKKCRLAVDHCHETMKIRGLLCGACNRGMGLLKEHNIQAALEYLKQHQAK